VDSTPGLARGFVRASRWVLKSLVNDLGMDRSVVPSRAAASLRSAESHLLVRRFYTTALSPFLRGAQAGEGGRARGLQTQAGATSAPVVFFFFFPVGTRLGCTDRSVVPSRAAASLQSTERHLLVRRFHVTALSPFLRGAQAGGKRESPRTPDTAGATGAPVDFYFLFVKGWGSRWTGHPPEEVGFRSGLAPGRDSTSFFL